MDKLKIVIYSTCQGRGLETFLMLHKKFVSQYTFVQTILNYSFLHEKKIIIENNVMLNNIKNADIFIYQPLDDIYGKNATNYVKTFLKETCIAISIPYVYNTSFWPLIVGIKGDTTDDWSALDNYKHVIENTDILDNLIKLGHSKDTILNLYDNNEINFNYDIRHRVNMNILKNKEETIDIKMHDFINDNLKTKRLFLYHSHPTSSVFIHMANQILNILNLEPLEEHSNIDLTNLQSGTVMPGISPALMAFPSSAIRHFGFEFETPQYEAIANNFFRHTILTYLNNKR